MTKNLLTRIIFLRFPNLKIRHRILAAAFIFGSIVVACPFFFSQFYTGLILSSGLVVFLISLWNLLIPDLSLLMKATKEFKNGNLDYKPEITGSTETAILAKSFIEMAQSIKKQNEELKELNRLKTDFVSTVSHELRTPLTAIKGSIALVLGEVTGSLNKDQKDILNITNQNTDRLIRLINDILDIAKIEAGAVKLHFSKHSIGELISHAIQSADAYARSHEVNIIYIPKDRSPAVVMDTDKIEQVLSNLLSNAIKFTPAGGSVTVDYEWDDNNVTISVTDTGRGIPEEFLSRIFGKFQQVDHSDRKALEGTGLGLAVVKGLVEEHGGIVSVTSKVDFGSQFSFTIPWNGHEFSDNPLKNQNTENQNSKAA